MRRTGVLIQVIGACSVWYGAAGADNEAADAIWLLCAAIGLLMMLLGRFLYLWSKQIEKERRSKRCRRHM